MGRGGAGWRRRRFERGFIPVWGLAAGLGVVAVVAGIIVTVIVVGSQAPPIGLTVSASASRNTGQDIAVVIPWTVHYPSVAYAAALSTYPTLTCTIKQHQLSQDRTFSNSVPAGGSDQTNSGSLTLNITGSDHSVQGDFNLACSLDKDGKQLATATSSFSIPPPSDASPSPSDTAPSSESASPTDTPSGAQIDGGYIVTWGQGVGGCSATNPPTQLVVTSSGSSVTVKLGDNLTMTGTMNNLNTFSASSTSSDGKTTYTVKGTFVVTASPITINNANFTAQDAIGGCGYDFTATHE